MRYVFEELHEHGVTIAQRIANRLSENGIETVEELEGLSREKLLSMDGIGENIINVLEETLGIRFRRDGRSEDPLYARILEACGELGYNQHVAALAYSASKKPTFDRMPRNEWKKRWFVGEKVFDVLNIVFPEQNDRPCNSYEDSQA